VSFYVKLSGSILCVCEREQGQDDPAHKLSANLYDIYHCCVYIEKLLMVDRGAVRKKKHVEFHSKHKFEKLVPIVAFIIRNLTQCTVT
jgi:hypothetical protein